MSFDLNLLKSLICHLLPIEVGLRACKKCKQ
jgi:hypothetical protein